MDATTKRYVDWIFGNLERQAGKTQTGLAERLGIAHPQISMLKSGKRDLKVREVPIIAEYLQSPPPPWNGPKAVEDADVLAVLGRIGGLTQDDLSFLLKNIKSARATNADAPQQTHPRDQRELPTAPRESSPS